jgi:hypothetical protein
MGSVEASGIRTFLRRRNALRAGRIPPPYSARAENALLFSAGVFPQNEQVFDRFSEVYLEAAAKCDALAWWDVATQGEILRTYCARATLVQMTSLEPYFTAPPWSRKLRGKRVLVVSPFAATVQRQYAKRRALWRDTEVLPEFELKTIRAPLSAGIAPSENADWFETLDKITQKMDEADYEVALIGAGAFSLPLAVHAKSRGKVGVHLGGPLQILFGIIGARWENRPDFKPFFNENWCRPSAEETPMEFRRAWSSDARKTATIGSIAKRDEPSAAASSQPPTR